MPLFPAQPVVRSRSWSLAVAALCGLAILPGLGAAQSPSITVSGGSNESVPGTYASGTYSTITVSGTGGAGERSTLTIDEAIEVDGGSQALSVFDGGLFNVNANVSGAPFSYTSGSFGGGGTLNLMSGTLALNALELSGSGAFQRTGGSYSVGSLSVRDGAAVTWTASDSLPSGYGFFGVVSGGMLELQTNFVGGEGSEVYLRGAGSQIIRSSGTETIAAAGLGVVDGANFTLSSGDAFDGLVAGELYYSPDPVAPSEITLAPGTTAVNVSFLGLGQGGSIVGLESASYTTNSVSVVGQRLDYRPTDSVSQSAFIGTSGTLSLQKNLALSGTYATLRLSGSGSALERNAFTVSTPAVSIEEGASFTLDEGVTVSRSISVLNYDGEPTSLTLGNSLVLSASDEQIPRISVYGSNASIVRSPGLTITATGAEVSANNSGSFTMESGDDFTGSLVSANSGGRLASSGPQALASVNVSGRNYETDAASTYTANGPLTITGNGYGQAFNVSYGGIFQANANVTTPNAFVWDGTLDLVSGTFAVADVLSLSGSTASVTRAPGAVISAPGAALEVTQLAGLTMGATDDFTDATMTVSYGGTAANAGSLTLAEVSVYGREFSTLAPAVYTADAPLVISGTGPNALAVGTSGVFRSNANVTVGGASVIDGMLDLVSGTFAVGGTLSISGSTASVTRAPGAVISAPGAAVQVSQLVGLTMGAADDFTNATMRVVYGGTAGNSGPQTLADLSVYGLDFVTNAPATYTADAPLVLSGTGFNPLFVEAGGVFRSNANVTTPSAAVSNGTLDLVSGTFAVGQGLFVSGSTASVLRAPGSVISAPGASVEVSSMATFTMGASDNVSDAAVSVFSGGTAANAGPQTIGQLSVHTRHYVTNAPSVYTADAPLVISSTGSYALFVGSGGVFRSNADVTVGDVRVSGGTLDLVSGTFTVGDTLLVSGSSASVTRAAGTSLRSGSAASLYVFDGATMTLTADDSLASANVSISGSGSRGNNSGPQTLKYVGATNDATYRADAPLVLNDNVFVAFGGVFEADAAVTVMGEAAVYDGGTLNLLSGTFASNDLSVSGTMLVNRAGGAAYDVGGLLSVTGSASLEFVAGVDSIARLFLDGGSLTTSGSGGLTLSGLTISDGGLLTLGGTSSVGGPGDWLLKMDASQSFALSTYVTAGSIVGLPGQVLNVVQQDGFAYVTAVPEPSAVVLALGGAGIAAVMLRRRSRAVRRGHPADTTTGPDDRCSGSGARS